MSGRSSIRGPIGNANRQPTRCINCGLDGPHYVGPSLGEPGFFACPASAKRARIEGLAEHTQRGVLSVTMDWQRLETAWRGSSAMWEQVAGALLTCYAIEDGRARGVDAVQSIIDMGASRVAGRTETRA